MASSQASPQSVAEIPWSYDQIRGHYFVYIRSRDLIMVYSGPNDYRYTRRPDGVRPQDLIHAAWEPGSQSNDSLNTPRSFLGHNTQGHVAQQQSQDINREIIGTQGERYRVLMQAATGVQNRIQLDPPQAITDPLLLRSGVPSRGMLLETPGDREALFASYRKRANPRQFFKVGKVFMVLWAEPAGFDNASEYSTQTRGARSNITRGSYGENVYSSVRRFVVIRESDAYCSALPITTYGGRGVAKPGVIKSEHAIVFSGRTQPNPRQDELPSRSEGGHGMRPTAIRVNPDSREDKLDPMSRINFGAVHTIQHNIKARPFGVVHDKSRADLLQQFASVWTKEQPARVDAVAGPSSIPGSRQGGPDSNLEGRLIQKLVEHGFSEEEAYTHLSKKMSELMNENDQPSSIRAGKQPVRPIDKEVASQKVLAVRAWMNEGYSQAEATRKTDAAFANRTHSKGGAIQGRAPETATKSQQQVGDEAKEEAETDDDDDQEEEQESEEEGGGDAEEEVEAAGESSANGSDDDDDEDEDAEDEDKPDADRASPPASDGSDSDSEGSSSDEDQ